MSPDLMFTVIAGNRILDWIVALVIAVAAALAIRFVKAMAVRSSKKHADQPDAPSPNIVIETLGATRWYFYLTVAVVAGASYLTVDPELMTVIFGAFVVITLIQCGVWLQGVLKALVHRWDAQRDSRHSATVAAGLMFMGKLVIWSAVVLLALANLGVEVSALIAGLGVGGVAIALAVQGLLADLFASLSMYFDRPFDIGDFIIVDDFLGTVSKIGLRTTRLNGLGGEQIVFANGDLVKSRIRNYARMQERRVVFSFGIEYNLPADKVERAAVIAREVIDETADVRLDRVHFKAYGAYSLDFEAVYYVNAPDYNLYMERQHEINMGIYRRFEADEIPFAFPTQTLHLRGGSELASSSLGKLDPRRLKGNGDGRHAEAGES